MQLVTVRFTTKHLVSVFDDRGRKTGEYEDAIPQCISGIPRVTAESYRKFDNWSVEPYVAEPERKSSFNRPNVKAGPVTITMSARRVGKTNAAKVAAAAASGDLAAAINAMGAGHD